MRIVVAAGMLYGILIVVLMAQNDIAVQRPTRSNSHVGVFGTGYFRLVDEANNLAFVRAGRLSCDNAGRLALEGPWGVWRFDPHIVLPETWRAGNLSVTPRGRVFLCERNSAKRKYIGTIALFYLCSTRELSERSPRIVRRQSSAAGTTWSLPAGAAGVGFIRQGWTESYCGPSIRFWQVLVAIGIVATAWCFVTSGGTAVGTLMVHSQLVSRLWAVSVVMASATIFACNLVDPDMWGHLFYGRTMWEAGAIPTTAEWTYTASTHPWINHEYLSQLAFAVVDRYFGITGLLVGKCCLGLVILAMMVWAAGAHGVISNFAWSFVLLIAVNLRHCFLVRPQLFTFLFLSSLLLLLHWAFHRIPNAPKGVRRSQLRWLCLAPLLFAVWANFHGGFLAGLCIMAAMFLGHSLDALYIERLASWRSNLFLATILPISVAATFGTPYGLRLHTWLFETLSKPCPEIVEWAPLTSTDAPFVPFLVLVAAALIAAFAGRPSFIDVVKVVVLGLVCWQAFHHRRHIALAAILSGFWVPALATKGLTRLRHDATRSGANVVKRPRLLLFVSILLSVAIGGLSITTTHRLSELPVGGTEYPIDAVDFMIRHKMSGHMVAPYNVSQYVIAALAPNIKVACDGRFRNCYPQEVIDMCFDLELGTSNEGRYRSVRSGPPTGGKILDYRRPTLAMIDRRSANSVAIMEAHASASEVGWVLLYQDLLYQIWGRRSIYDDPANGHFLEVSRRLISNVVSTTRMPWPANAFHTFHKGKLP